MFQDFVPDLLNFLAYFGSGLLATAVFLTIYILITPYNEITLIKEKNAAAAIAFSGSLLGFSLAITGLIKHAVSLMDFYAWAGIAILIQLLAYFAVRVVFPKISQRITEGEVPAGIWLAASSVAAGMLNAASMSY